MILFDVLFLAVFWMWAVTAALFLRNTLLPRLPITVTPDAWGLSYDTVSFEATDGVRLEGWIITGAPGRPWVIGCHGVGSNRADLLDIAAALHTAGFNLFLFDFRGHGGSAGRTTSFGWLEQRDLEGALAFLGRQQEIPLRPYGIYGISMGSVVALMVAARDERLGAVVADSPYTRLDESLAHHLKLLYYWLPARPFAQCVWVTYRLRFGVWPQVVSPIDAAARLSPRPIFLIHGSEDPRMPIEGAHRIFQRAGDPKTVWVVDGAGHLEASAYQPQAYRNRVVGFFTSHLQ